METRTHRVLAAVVAVVAVLVAATLVVSDGPWSQAGTPDTRVEIVMQDYGFEVDEWHVPAGEPLELVIVNRDEVSHPLSFGRAEIEDDLLRSVGYEEDLFAGSELRVTPRTALVAPTPPDRATTVQVPGGSTVTVEVELPAERAGTWHVGCFLARGCHHAAGLAGTLVVEG